MSSLIQAIVSGLVTGSIYALMTVGLTLIYGTLRTLNMAHGALLMIGGYVAWLGLQLAGIPPAAGLLLAMGATFLIGMAIERVSVRPLIGKPGFDFEMTAFISTFAVTVVLQNAALLVFGARNKALPPLVGGRLELVAGVSVTRHSVLMAIVALALLAGLQAFLTRTRYGLAIRAVAQQLDAARLMGVPADRVYSLTMGVASALAGIAGVLLASVFFVSPNSGDLPLLKGLIVAIFGGLGSVRGTVLAAFLIGLLEALVSLYLGVKWSLPVLFLFIMAVLLVRPSGLLGKPEEARL
ncbi:MAG TPA: branched-chain amino acid ABC transporter permease [Actinomycetota bacterium]|nr:branched-chain amino acid ABC transporter permease [Actinomycetota bacterium]